MPVYAAGYLRLKCSYFCTKKLYSSMCSSCADVPLRNYSLNVHVNWVGITRCLQFCHNSAFERWTDWPSDNSLGVILDL